MTYSQAKGGRDGADQDHVKAIKEKTSPCWGLSRYSGGGEHCSRSTYFLLIRTKGATKETLLNF